MTRRDRNSAALSLVCHGVARLTAEVERLTETMRREVDAAEQRGYQSGYTAAWADRRTMSRADPVAALSEDRQSP